MACVTVSGMIAHVFANTAVKGKVKGKYGLLVPVTQVYNVIYQLGYKGTWYCICCNLSAARASTQNAEKSVF